MSDKKLIAREHHCITSLVRALVIEAHPYKVSYAYRGHFVKIIIIKGFFFFFFLKKKKRDLNKKINFFC